MGTDSAPVARLLSGVGLAGCANGLACVAVRSYDGCFVDHRIRSQAAGADQNSGKSSRAIAITQGK